MVLKGITIMSQQVCSSVINFNEKARTDIVNPVNNQNPASKKIHDADIQ